MFPSIGRSRGHPRHTDPLRPKMFSIPCSFLKIWQNGISVPHHSRVAAPSYGESWIRPRPEIIFCTILIVFTSRRDALQRVERAEHLRLTDTGLCVGNPAEIIPHLIQSYIPPVSPPRSVADLRKGRPL